MQGSNRGLPEVPLKKLKRLLKSCRTKSRSQHHQHNPSTSLPLHCPGNFFFSLKFHIILYHSHMDFFHFYYSFWPVCNLVCDATFFPSLLKEISAVVCCFNEKAKTLLELHSSSCSIKCILWFGASKLLNNRETMMQEAKKLITYAVINSAAIRKILKKYDKVLYFLFFNFILQWKFWTLYNVDSLFADS